MTGMIDQKAFDDAWVAVGWDNQNPQSTLAQERFVAAYEQAKLAVLPQDRVELVTHAIEPFLDQMHEASFQNTTEWWSAVERVAKAALAAMPEPVEVDGVDPVKAIADHLTLSRQQDRIDQAHWALIGLQVAGYRIVKGEA